jgi:hypothetical protein
MQLLAMVAFCGCVGCNSKPVLVPASGTIFQPDGTPIPSAGIMFWPLDNPAAFKRRYDSLPFGLVNDKGHFDMCLKAAESGIPAGRYRVTISLFDNDAKLPKIYEDWKHSPWEVTIPAKGQTDIVLRM